MKMSAAKRGLYKPATKEKVTTKEKRKPLAQGRLVTGSANTASRPNTSATLQHDIADDGLKATLAYSQSHLQAQAALTSSPTILRRSDDAPRRDQPHASMTQSPQRAEPSQSLDLSDTESDVARPSLAGRSDSSILMIDASRQTCGANTSEVDIAMSHAPSPARVVCHAPSIVHSRLRNTGDIDEARKVTVDHMPSINVLSYSDYTDPDAPCPISTFKSPQVIRENTIVGGPIDPHSTAKPTISKNLFATILDESKNVHPARNYLQPRDMSTDNVSDASSVDSTSDITSEISVTTKTMSASVVEEQKKKKGAHFPTSRYLQTSNTTAKTKTKGPMKATDRTIMVAKSTSGKLKPKLTGNTSTTAALKPKVTGNISKFRVVTSKPNPTEAGTNVSRTTPNKSSSQKPSSAKKTGKKSPLSAKKTGKKSSYTTSTPTGADGDPNTAPTAETSWQQGRYQLTPELRGSAIRRTMKDSSPHITLLPKLTDDSKMSSMSTICSNDSQGQKPTEEVTQLQLDLDYAKYLRWSYIESRSRKAFKKQEKNVMADLYTVSEMVSEKQKRKDELDHQLARLRHANAVDDALLLQEAALEPVVSGLDQLGKQYRTLATALDTTRHQLPTKGVYIPDNEDQFIDQLQSALNESEQLLGELSVMTRQKHPKVTTFAETLHTLGRTINEEVSELARCQESLAAATTLTVQECSLLIQDIQLGSTHHAAMDASVTVH